MQNVPDAGDIVKIAIDRKHINNYTSQPFSKYDFYRKTSIDAVIDKEIARQRMQSRAEKGGLFYHKFVVPFVGWLDYAREVPNTDDMDLTNLLYEDYGTVYENHQKKRRGIQIHASRNLGFFETIGQQNIAHFLDEVFGEIDLYDDDSELMLLNFKSPLADDAYKTYQYNLLGIRNIDGHNCYEIAFFARNPKDNAFAGYLYIDISNTFALRKAVFTLNDPSSMNFMKNVLITHVYSDVEGVMCPVKKENAVMLGDEMQGSFSIIRTLLCSGFDFEKIGNMSWKTVSDPDFRNRDNAYWQSVRPIPLTPSQMQMDELVKIAPDNTTYIRMQELLSVLLTNHVTVGGIKGKVELGPILQFLSYNDMEGMRLKIGGNTKTTLMKQLQVGGYVAYGIKDEQWKYRGDLIYSFFHRDKYIWEYPKRLLSFTYVNDLNIPGQDLLTTNRDNVMYSFSHAETNNMSHQKIGLLTFENENKRNFSYKIGTKYTLDTPAGIVKYMQVSGQDTAIVDRLNTAEISLSLRYSPHERFFQNRDKRLPIRKGDFELTLDHRIGIKGFFGSDYNYQITSANAYKKFNLGNNIGSLDTRLSAGIVWNTVPFPLLFIPIGNQSYIYHPEDYNCMNFYEFTTDRFVAGNIGFLFNWSPVSWFDKRSKIKTSLGVRAIYGPLSDKNNPEFHSGLFVFNEGVTPLGTIPYAELNIGLANVFKLLRIEYAHRLTYIDRYNEGGNKPTSGSLLITGSFSF